MPEVETAFRAWTDDVITASETFRALPVEELMRRGARRRRRKVIAASSMMCLVAALVVILLTTGILAAGRSSVQVSETPSTSSVGDRFVPAESTVSGGDQRLALRFLDGKSVELSYPASANVAALGITASIEIAWPGVSATPNGCCQPGALAYYTDLRTQFGSTKPIKVFSRGPAGQVLYLPGDAIGSPHQNFLVFTFGHWLLEIPDAGSLGAKNLSTLAANLSGSVDSSGYLHLFIREPLVGLLHPSIVFGAASVNSPQIEVTPRSCSPSSAYPFRQGDGESGVAVCDSEGTINASVTGPKTFVDQLASGLKLGPRHP
jgi:hypothetical protein